MAIRVALIGTGNCGSLALRQLIEDDRFDLTNVWVSTEAKVGKDAGELARLDTVTGVTATGDLDAIIASKPDCAVYCAMGDTRPIEAFEDNNHLSVPAALLGSGEHYALEVSGDSMIEAGILDGDYALIRKADTARDGEIVVALVRGEEATLKYLRREDGKVRLDPANATYDPQFYRPDEVEVQGKLAGLLRRYH